MSETKEDRVTREILKRSVIDTIDPDFTEMMMKRIYRENRKRHIMKNLFVNFSIFAIIDTFILLAIRLTGLSALELVNASVSFLNRLLGQAGRFKEAIAGNDLAMYLVLSIGGIAALLAIIELKLNSWDR